MVWRARALAANLAAVAMVFALMGRLAEIDITECAKATNLSDFL